ncbi:hypothetical protein KEM48_002233 [Puccinia striiformis f. sp. tritici PST-130]|nr:hypothetical protein KEM48_002233 [Puccinia striiformis f. sp. tritici PST-130]
MRAERWYGAMDSEGNETKIQQKHIFTKSTMTNNPVCVCHNKILELKLDHELLSEVNVKTENLINGTIKPIKYLTEKISMFEHNQNQQFQQLLSQFDSITSLINQSQRNASPKNTKEYNPNIPELADRNKQCHLQKDMDGGRYRAMESPFHPRTKTFKQPNPFVPSNMSENDKPEPVKGRNLA